MIPLFIPKNHIYQLLTQSIHLIGLTKKLMIWLDFEFYLPSIKYWR